MILHYKNPGIKFPVKVHGTKIRNINSLLVASLNAKEVKHDIVLNIRFDGDQLSAFLKSILEKSFSEDFSLADHNIKPAIKEFPEKGEDTFSVIWINDENHLTSREVEVMEKLAKGLLNKEIADSLGVSINTVKNHLKNIFRKLDVGNRSEAIIGYSKIKNKKNLCDY
jgi:DNA-binding NarL/FixJ family response regulator